MLFGLVVTGCCRFLYGFMSRLMMLYESVAFRYF